MSRVSLEATGTLFETNVCMRLQEAFPTAQFIHSAVLPAPLLYPKKGVTEIDLIMLHEKGIFVIEVKAWKNLIEGDRHDSNWHAIASSPKRMNIINVWYQNFNHIRILRSCLYSKGLELKHMHNLICVPDTTKIKSDVNEIYNLSYLIPAIKTLIDTSDETINVTKYLSAIRTIKAEKKKEVVVSELE